MEFKLSILFEPKNLKFKYLLYSILEKLASVCTKFNYTIEPDVELIKLEDLDSKLTFNEHLRNFNDSISKLLEITEDLNSLDTWDIRKRERILWVLKTKLEILNTSIGAIYSQGYQDGCDWERSHNQIYKSNSKVPPVK